MTTVTADIQKYEICDGNIYYFIKVVYNGREWAVRKRYSDFSRLDEFLHRDGYNLSYALPSKQFWKTFDKKTLIERQKGLQSYLNILLKSTVSSDNSLVKEFLEVDHNRLQHARKQSFHALKRTERMESVISYMSRSVIYIPVKNTNVVINTAAITRPTSTSMSLQRSNTLTRDRQSSNASGRDRQGSAAVPPPSPNFNRYGAGPHMEKSKSLSFSMKFSFSSNSRGTSFATMERKAAVNPDYSVTSNKSSSVDVATLKDLLKKEAYEYGVTALWDKYKHETEQILQESDYIYNAHGSNSKDGRRSALPLSYFRTKTTDIPSVSARKGPAALLASMHAPIKNTAEDSLEQFLDAKFRPAKTKSFTEKYGTGQDSAEDIKMATATMNFVALQRKYEALVFLKDDYPQT